MVQAGLPDGRRQHPVRGTASATMDRMTPSLFQQRLEKQGVSIRQDHALWLVEQVPTSAGPADIRNKMIYIVQYAFRMGWLTPGTAAALSQRKQDRLQTLVMQTLAEVLGHPDPTVRASTTAPEQQGHLPLVYVNPPPDDPYALAAWCEELDIMN